MEAQHETMKILGRQWSQIEKSLFSTSPDFKGLVDAVKKMDRWQRHMPKFMLHKFQKEKPEFDRYAAEFDGMLSGFRRMIEQRDWVAAQKDYVRIDAMSCTKCHLKFRWGVAEDLSRFPDLRRLEYAREK